MSFLLFAVLLSSTLSAADLAARRQSFGDALGTLQRGGQLDTRARHSLRDHPLYGYLQYAQLLHRLDKIDRSDIDAFLKDHGDLAVVPALQRRWLSELARRRDWAGLLRDWSPQEDLDLRCYAAVAQLSRAPRDAGALDAAQALWLNGRSLPDACDPAFAALSAAGRITPSLRWQRIDLAAEAGNTGLMRYLARGLPAAERPQAEAYADYLDTPSASAAAWPATARSAQIAGLGLQRLARHDADRAEALLSKLNTVFGSNSEPRDAVRYAIALWSAASYEATAAKRLAAVPAAAYDARLHEWRVREALARRDWAAAQHAIAAMLPQQREEPRWRYIDARLAELLGAPARAKAGFARLAEEAHYHGFLAADHLDQDYAMCALEAGKDAAERRRVAALPGLQRALELHALRQPSWALAEWNQQLPQLNDGERAIAVDLAVKAGWTDRAVFTLNSGDDLRYYRLRFPIAHKSHLTREAERHGLDPAWVAALIRAESAWQPQARSHANALGLMQLLPGTAAALAKRDGLPWKGARSLYQPDLNISLGTAYLADMLARKATRPFLATAAYNAGPSPVQRWLGQRPVGEVDLWIETIPYKETRDYVVRVMAFSVIYDWRLGRDAYPLSARLIGQPNTQIARRAFHCPPTSQLAARP